MKLERADYVRSLEQLLTVSGILAGFATSGLIALPGIDESLYNNIVQYSEGDFGLAFYFCFYAILLSTLSFLGTIMIVVVYKVHNYFIPIAKLRRVHFISNIVFNIGVAALIMAVIAFGIPNKVGVFGSMVIGLGMAACFIWENMLPWQRKKREQQMLQEQEKNSQPTLKE
jgi:hypothetical protein